MSVEFRADRPIWTDMLDLYARQQIDGKIYAWVAEIKVKEIEAGLCFPKFIDLSMMSDAGQSLFDALWSVGFRPHKGEASAAHVEALKYHLEDMRTLALKGKKDE